MAKSHTKHVFYVLGCILLLILILSSLGIIGTGTSETTSEETSLPATDTWWGPAYGVPYGPPVQERVVVIDGGWGLGGWGGPGHRGGRGRRGPRGPPGPAGPAGPPGSGGSSGGGSGGSSGGGKGGSGGGGKGGSPPIPTPPIPTPPIPTPPIPNPVPAPPPIPPMPPVPTPPIPNPPTPGQEGFASGPIAPCNTFPSQYTYATNSGTIPCALFQASLPTHSHT